MISVKWLLQWESEAAERVKAGKEGALTTTLLSLTLGGIPLPILTRRLILMYRKVLTIQVAIIDAEIVLYIPFSKQAMTMLCFPMDPKVYALRSFNDFSRGGWV
jgi:hypothetical protein